MVAVAETGGQIAPQFSADVPEAIRLFLQQPSSIAWAEGLAGDVPTLLHDHANCELKAAASAMSLLHRYAHNDALVYQMSRLAREELRHFEQVKKWLKRYEIGHRTVSAARYASGMREHVGAHEPQKLIDTLIVGALIEARSCERFALIAPFLDAPLAAFYRGLLASESRHFEHYLALAEAAAQTDIAERVSELRVIENALIAIPATEVRFHSGPPAT
ncbi:MAG: tRNA isopentenyl-2-thiomethyl-A-37 hydroxylase MiaE [Pseudomonadota bacterium]